METLRFGSEGPWVQLLQSTLSRIGYYQEKTDGIFGPMTQAAVIAFQRSYGLTPDGIVEKQTWSALMRYIDGYFTYTVKAGDTLHTIAQRYNTSVTSIVTANPGIAPNNLQIGQHIIVPYAYSVVFTDISYPYEIMQLNLHALKVRYPFLEISSIGKSILGREISMVKIGSGDTEVSYNASHHANEWINSPVLMKFLEEYARAYSFGGQLDGQSAAQLYQSTTLYLVPMVNPDGVDLVTGALPTSDPAYQDAAAMNPAGEPFPEDWKANIKGVDLNLQYPAGWETAKEIKYAQGYTSPGPQNFVGPYPLSEPESRAMAEFTKARNFRMTLAYHTQGETIFWKYADYEPEGSLVIAQAFSKVSGYAVSTTPYESGNAGYKDWFIQEYNLPGYTIESGLGVNPLPISQFDQIYEDNTGILTLGMALAK